MLSTDERDAPMTDTAVSQRLAAIERTDGVMTQARKMLTFRNSAAIYLFILMFVVYSLWMPDTFLTWGTWRSLISSQAIICLVAVAMVLPTAAGVIDLSIGTQVGLGSIVVARLLVGTVPLPIAIGLSILAGCAVGVVSWLLITRLRIPSFIATLGISSLLAATIAWISSGEQIINLPPAFTQLAQGDLFGLSYPFYIMIVVSIVLWYVLERTPLGRRIYATGGGISLTGDSNESAALAGIRTSRVIMGALITSGGIAAGAGMLQASQLAVGDPTTGPTFLLPVLAAVFLGSTQFRGGRFNVWGTVVVAYVLAVGVKGLQLAGLPIWIPDLFNGVALLCAVGLAAWRKPDVTRREALMRLLTGSTGQARAVRRARRKELLARVTGHVAAHRLAVGSRESWKARLSRAISVRNISALYLFAGLFVLFALWVPDSFLTVGTWQSLLSDQAITCLVAIAFVLPISAGVLDLAIGVQVGLGSILVAHLLASDLPIPLAVVLSLLGGACVGIFSWLMITKAKIPSFIATLGVSSLLTAAIAWISSSRQIVDLPPGFSSVGNGEFLGLKYPFYIMLVVAVVLWYVLERTPVGRRVYATGADPYAADLSGIRTSRVILGVLIAGGMISAGAGVLATSQLSVGDPTTGPGFLLPVLAAVFLGATQFGSGRINVWGTVVASYVLAEGVKGLQLVGLPVWIVDYFNGAALLIAVGVTVGRRVPRRARTAKDRQAVPE